MNQILLQNNSLQANIRPGADSHPKQEEIRCRGMDLRYLRDAIPQYPGIDLSWLIFANENFPEKQKFFTPFFEKLAGTDGYGSRL